MVGTCIMMGHRLPGAVVRYFLVWNGKLYVMAWRTQSRSVFANSEVGKTWMNFACLVTI